MCDSLIQWWDVTLPTCIPTDCNSNAITPKKHCMLIPCRYLWSCIDSFYCLRWQQPGHHSAEAGYDQSLQIYTCVYNTSAFNRSMLHCPWWLFPVATALPSLRRITVWPPPQAMARIVRPNWSTWCFGEKNAEIHWNVCAINCGVLGQWMTMIYFTIPQNHWIHWMLVRHPQWLQYGLYGHKIFGMVMHILLISLDHFLAVAVPFLLSYSIP